jgi:thiamine-monophosphate kinase
MTRENMTPKNMPERELIAAIRKMSGRSPSRGLRVSIGDDCAVWQPRSRYETIVTTDQLVEGVHYRPEQPAKTLGARLVGRGLSDIAAMGGEPRLAFLNVAWPASLPERWRLDFLRGFGAETIHWRTVWAGGDVSGTAGPAVASITVIGETPTGNALLRSGARPGDGIYVSGRLGAASMKITPRLALGQTLRRRKLATACMDISDGLSTDLHHLCEESGVGALLEASRIPAAGRASAPQALDQALNWGEDYELLFTAAPATRVPARIAGVAIRRVGQCTARTKGVRIVDAAGCEGPLEPRGWEHLG